MDDRRMLLVSILYQLARGLLGLTTVLMRQDLDKDAELLVDTPPNVAAAGKVTRSMSARPAMTRL